MTPRIPSQLIPPQSSHCLKILAHQYQEDGVGHMQSLDLTSKHFGYAGWKKAQQTLPAKPFKITVEAAFTSSGNDVGLVSLTLPFKKSHAELFRSARKQALRFFDYKEDRNAFVLTFESTSDSDAKKHILQAFRQLYFMQETGLLPYLSNDGKNITSTQIPHECFNNPNNPPYFDHPTFWSAPDSKHLVIINQPYKILSLNLSEQRKKTQYGIAVEEWMKAHGFEGNTIQHRGFYLDGNVSTFTMVHENSGYHLHEIITGFDRVPDQLLQQNWKYFQYHFLIVG